MFLTTFFTHKKVSQHFALIKAKKSTKIFQTLFFKKFYQLLSPYGTKISIFDESVSDNFFHSQNVFQNISRRLKPKIRPKLFTPHFSSVCPPPYEGQFFFQKLQFGEKIGRTFYSDFQKIQMSHPGVVGPRKSGFQKCPSPPSAVLVTFFLLLCV